MKYVLEVSTTLHFTVIFPPTELTIDNCCKIRAYTSQSFLSHNTTVINVSVNYLNYNFYNLKEKCTISTSIKKIIRCYVDI